jgi:hypothetical protein
MRTSRLAPLAAALCLIAVPAFAQNSTSPLKFYGFGGWRFSQTNENAYLGGTRSGAIDNGDLALGAALKLHDRFRLNAQGEAHLENGEREIELDYALAEFRLNDALRLRAGQVKHPFGIFTEVYDVGTIRPFFSLPQSVYGHVGLVAEGFRGVGLTGGAFAGAWGFDYDLYGGSINLIGHAHPEGVAVEAHDEGGDDIEGEEEEEEEGEQLSGIIGGRFSVTTPLNGLRFGVSAYSGKSKVVDEGERDRVTTGGAFGEYLYDAWSLRSEFVWSSPGHDITTHSAFVEGARKLVGGLEAALRVDWSDLHAEVDEDFDRDLLGHREVAAGLNYWFTATIVTRLSLHDVKGRRFIETVDAEGVAPGRTRLVVFGLQFAF